MFSLTPIPVWKESLSVEGGFSFAEISGRELVSLAIACGEEKAFSKTFKAVFGKLPPKPGKLIQIKGGEAFWTSPDQIMLMKKGENVQADQEIGKAFEGLGYSSMQTDGWLQIECDDPNIEQLWERMLPLDFSKTPPGSAARTSAHHIGVMVIKRSNTHIEFLTPRSSSESFRRALSHSKRL